MAEAHYPIAFVRHSPARDFYEEAHTAAARLRRLGHSVDLVEWHDPAVKWERYGLINIQFCADYIERPLEFQSWLSDLQKRGLPLFNPAEAVMWNMDKAYLKDLESEGFKGIPTIFLDRGEKTNLASVVEKAGWHEVVVKPAISAGGKTTLRFPATDAAQYQEHLDAMIHHSGVLVQAFLPEVMSAGEWSLVFIGGAFSHALHKLPAVGEFLVHEHFGGTTTPTDAPEHIRHYAERLIKGLPYDLLYARVDGIETPEGFLLMELEIIEPWLWLHLCPEERLEAYVQAMIARAKAPRLQAA